MESKCWCVFRRRSCATFCVSTVALKCSSFQPACATSDRDSTFSALQHNKDGAPQPQTLTETRRCCVTLGENQPCDILLTSILFYQAAAAVAAARRRQGGGSSQVITNLKFSGKRLAREPARPRSSFGRPRPPRAPGCAPIATAHYPNSSPHQSRREHDPLPPAPYAPRPPQTSCCTALGLASFQTQPVLRRASLRVKSPSASIVFVVPKSLTNLVRGLLRAMRSRVPPGPCQPGTRSHGTGSSFDTAARGRR